MEAADELLTIAQLAIGLAGFSGVVVAFSRQEGLREIDRFYFIALLTCAFTAVLLAFVPFFFHHEGLTGAALWKGSSIVMLIFWILVVGGLGIGGIRLPNNQASQFGISNTIVLCAVPLFNIPCMIANIAGYPMEPGANLYLVGLFLWLTVSVLVFTHLVLIGVQE
jgi:hypothetical protein